MAGVTWAEKRQCCFHLRQSRDEIGLRHGAIVRKLTDTNSAAAADACIDDHPIDPAQRLIQLPKRGEDGVMVIDVKRPNLDPATLRRQFGLERFQPIQPSGA